VLLVLVSFASLAASNPAGPFLIKNWTTSDGLPENTVRAIIETRDGYLWMGTANGLARFDGVRFTRFNSANTPSLFVDDITGLHEDSHGAIWISTRRGALKYLEGRFEAVTLKAGGPPVSFGNFTGDTDGRLWMHGPAGLACWDGTKLNLVPLPESGPRSVQHLCAALDGGIWIAGNDGLWRHRGSKFEKVAVTPIPQMVAVSRDGRLYGLVGGTRLFRLEDGRWSQVAEFEDERCSTLYAAPDGDIWLGAAARNRAFRLRADQLSEVNAADGLEGNRAICFTEDREGNLWMGMNGAGVYRLRERRLELFGRNEGLQALSLAGVCEDAAGTIQVSVMGWTLQRFVGGRFEPLDLAASDDPFTLPTAVLAARTGGVWAGTYYGTLCRIQDGRIVERIGSASGTRALFLDKDGGLWRGTRTSGIEYFSGTNVTLFTAREGLSFNNVYCFAQDFAGAIWAGTEEGLNRITRQQIERFTRTNGLGHNFISALCVDSRGTVWVGTLGGGLSAWHGTRFVTFTTREGLADNTITQLLEDNYEQLWIGSRAGLMRVTLDDLHGLLEGRLHVVTGALIGRNEGLVRPDCWTEYQPAALKARDGRLWFCTSSGVAVIDPLRFAKPAPPPIVHIEEVMVDGVYQSPGGKQPSELRIPPGRQRVEIRYTGISPSGSELVRFRYRLKGYDRDWVEAGGDRFASYSHIKPGRYTFQVRAANNDGAWNEAGAALGLTLEPFFWQTGWFRGLMLLGFIGVGPAFYVWRMRRLEARRAAQEAFARQLIDSQEQERQRIAAELHDSLGQNLLVIKNRAALALAQKAQPEKMAAQVMEVSAMASAAIHEVREIAQNLRPFQLDELGLTKSIAAMARQMSDSSQIAFQTDLQDVDGTLPREFEINFYRIAQECLNNIVKHSQARKASIQLRRDAGSLRLSISDDGQGFEPTTIARSSSGGFGLTNIVERARSLGGEITFHSQPGEGTRVELVVPLR